MLLYEEKNTLSLNNYNCLKTSFLLFSSQPGSSYKFMSSSKRERKTFVLKSPKKIKYWCFYIWLTKPNLDK